MKKTTKKIIAREFLILIVGIIFFFVLLVTWLKLHETNAQKEQKLERQITEIINVEPLNLLNDFVKNLNKEEFRWEDINPKLKKYKRQSLMDFVVTLNSGKYKKLTDLYSKFPEFGFNEKGLPKKVDEILYFEKLDHLENIQSSFFNKTINSNDVYRLAFIIFSAFFVLRYLIYAVRWSLLQLKN
ncbi:hypothetical protein [Sediminibacter sp. Hel_I_10]|uniref:hypothetical protein n=1 Tax=Sediminibacter sp. Hel_I_10 TaxID=1392490 RepID=UPI000478A003|nr:hypothetical protein [Sediminibacter sp. Hel_I_10]